MELAIVIAVVTIISAIAVPSMIGWRSASQFRGAVANLRGDLNWAKLMAIRDGVMVAIQFEADRYRIFLDNGGGANSGDLVRQAGERYIRTRNMPGGVAIDLAATSFDSDRTGFSNRGLPENLGQVVVVNNKDNDQRSISLNRLGRMVVN
jgi:Tfp pilus assembly protein FimT